MTPIFKAHSKRNYAFIAGGAFVAVLLSYGLFEAHKLIQGPQIVLESPSGAATSSPALLVSGTAHNISFLTINDRPSFTDESGHFSLLLSVPTGYTVVTVRAVDRFGRRAEKSVSLTVGA